MAKKTTPKQHRPRAHTRTQRSAWMSEKRKLFAAATHLVLCPACGMPRRTHFACPACGFYGGETVIEHAAPVAPKATTRVKA